MKIANLVDAASKTALNKVDLETTLETWMALGREQNASVEYLNGLSKAAELVKNAPTVQRGVLAVRLAKL